MEHTIKKTAPNWHYLIMAISILLSCFLLFSLDEDMHGLSDFFEVGNLIGLAIYFIPTLLVSFVFYSRLAKRQAGASSIITSLAISIPFSFAFIIAVLNMWMK